MSWFWKRATAPAAPHADRHGDPLPSGAVGRLGTSRLQHVVDQGNEGLGALAFSPDETLLAGAGRDGRVSLWDVATGRLMRVLDRRGGEVSSMAFSPDGRHLVTGGRDGRAVLWDVQSGRLVYEVEADVTDVVAVAFSPRGGAWAAAGHGAVRVFASRRPELLHEITLAQDEEEGRSERFVALAFSPDGTRLAAASAYVFKAEEIPPDKVEDFNLLSDLPFGDCGDMMNYIMSDPQGFAESMRQKAENMMRAMKEEYGDASPPGRGFTFGEEGGVARGWRVGEAGRLSVWRLPDGAPEVCWDMEEGAPYLLAFSADGTVLASVGRGVQAWDLASRRRLAPGRLPARWHAAPGFTAQGRTILVSHDGRGPAQVWDAVAGTEVRALDLERSWGPFAFSPRGDRLALTFGRDTVELRDAESGRDLIPLPRHPAWISGLALAATAGTAAVVSAGVHLWDRATGTPLHVLSEHCRLPALSPDGTRLAGIVSTQAGEANVVVWDWRSGRRLAELEGLEPAVLLFPDDTTLLVGNALGQVGRYDLAAGKWRKILRGPGGVVDSLAVSPCGVFLAAGGEEPVVRLWRLDTGESLRDLPVPVATAFGEEAPARRPASLAVAPGGARLAWGSTVGTFLAWDTATGKPLSRLRLPGSVGACAVAFDARGRCLAAEATEVTREAHEFRVKLWDVGAGKALFTSEPQPHPTTELVFSADGRLVASASADRTVLLWATDVG